MCNPGTLQTAAFVLCLRLSYLVCWFFKGRNSISYHPLSLLELNPLFLKAPGLKPCWFSKSDIKRTHLLSANPQYQKYLVWGLILSLLQCLFCIPFVVSYAGSLVPICVYAHLPLFHMDFSLKLVVEGLLCLSSRSFSDLVAQMLLLPQCIYGTRWAQDLPTLPSSYLLILHWCF